MEDQQNKFYFIILEKQYQFQGGMVQDNMIHQHGVMMYINMIYILWVVMVVIIIQ